MQTLFSIDQPYWAKDLILIVTELSNYGMQAWVNSYYDIQSERKKKLRFNFDYAISKFFFGVWFKFKDIEAEDLKKRGGSIQAALNLEFPDIYIHKLELKIEGANGKLPNLDLFNSIIHICASTQFECSLEAEKGGLGEGSFKHYNKRNKAPIDLMEGFENTVNMVFKQASGMPSSLHGYFLNHRIEALTISGAKTKAASSKRQNPKKNLLKATRIIESTLRSINNLQERFHQSFFFYLLPSSHHYISIAMYMPVFGLLVLPILIQIVTVWFSMFLKKTETKPSEDNVC